MRIPTDLQHNYMENKESGQNDLIQNWPNYYLSPQIYHMELHHVAGQHRSAHYIHWKICLSLSVALVIYCYHYNMSEAVCCRYQDTVWTEKIVKSLPSIPSLCSIYLTAILSPFKGSTKWVEVGRRITAN